MLRTGRRTVSTSVRDNAEITIVGELPPQTAKRIAENIKFGAVINLAAVTIPTVTDIRITVSSTIIKRTVTTGARRCITSVGVTDLNAIIQVSCLVTELYRHWHSLA